MKCRENPRQQKRENPEKLFIEVIVLSTFDGILEPIRFRTEQGARFSVSKVLFSQPAASQRAGGAGIKYNCKIDVAVDEDTMLSREIDLYHDGDFWFVEREQLMELFA